MNEVIETKRPLAEGDGATKGSIARELRLRIVSGEFGPGKRLPTRSELQQHFGTTKVTVQRAFDDLVEDGFILADGRRGTFVSATPPHLTRYGLVFMGHPDQLDWPPFLESLRQEAAKLAKAGGRQFPCYYCVDQHQNSDDYSRLLRELHTQQLAGIVFTYTPEFVAHTRLMETHGVPMVAISDLPRFEIPVVSIDYSSFFEKALDHLAARGKRRVAALVPEMLYEAFSGQFRMGVAQRGLCTKPYWWQPVYLGSPEFARPYAHLMMHPNQAVRPDALIIANDNLTESTLAGLMDAGIRVPDDVEIVAHCNFPVDSLPSAPMQRLGYDVRIVLDTCLQAIDLQRRGEIVPLRTAVPAVMESLVPR